MTLPPSAALGAAGDLAAISDTAYRRIVGVNVDGVFLGVRALLPAMTKQQWGRIVATASVGGLTPVPFDPLYAMTKHAVVGLVRSAAPALASQGITLSAICPGGVDTPLVPDYVRAFSPPLLTPRRWGAPWSRFSSPRKAASSSFGQVGPSRNPSRPGDRPRLRR